MNTLSGSERSRPAANAWRKAARENETVRPISFAKAAARIAAELLGGGSLYERYYGIDYQAVRNLAIVETGEVLTRSYGARTSPGFAKLCVERAGAAASSSSSSSEWRHAGGSVAANGMVIEQAQILTTHNLATLVHRVGIAPAAGWEELARRCFVTVCRLTTRVQANPRLLTTIKDVAYALSLINI